VLQTLQDSATLRKGCKRLEYAHFYAQELGRVLAKFADQQAQKPVKPARLCTTWDRKKPAHRGGVFVQLGGSLVEIGAGVTHIIKARRHS
jgi:hypothetical protein